MTKAADRRCYQEFNRDDHADRVSNQLKVFIPVSCNHTQVFGILGVALNVQSMRFLKGRNHVLVSHWLLKGDFAKVSALKQAVLTEAKIRGQLEGVPYIQTNRLFNRI